MKKPAGSLTAVRQRRVSEEGAGVMKPYEFTYGHHTFIIPEYMRDAIKLYLERGIEPGDFLSAVICNDLREAVGRADDVNIYNLPAYVNFFYNHAPHGCWGSPENMKAWMEKFHK